MQNFFNKDIPEIFERFKDNWNVLNVATFGTEAPRSAIMSGCKGYRSDDYPNGIDNDVASYLTSLIPEERGKAWSLEDCIFGNEEKDRKPIKELITALNNYPNLQDIVLSISGLINKRSIHAAGLYLYNDGFLKHNAMMKAPNGQATTQFDKEDSDYMGSLKYDFLTVEAIDKLRVALDLLIEDNIIEDKGSLKENYKNYLSLENVEYDIDELWEAIGKNEIVNLFQFDSIVGGTCVKKLKPESLKELASANSLMRLMAEQGQEQPVDKFIRFKNDKSQWTNQMNSYELTEDEQKVITSYLSDCYGVASTQEDVMELAMSDKVANFTLEEANKLRKSIAKAKPELIEEVEQKFFNKGLEKGNRKNILDYVWNEQIKPQLGYSFSRNHTIPYSMIAIQEALLYIKYPSLYWNTAVLTVNSQSMEEEEIEGLNIKSNKSVDYGKLASAIGEMLSNNVEVALPDINKSKKGFKPDLENNQILFGLRGISRIGNDLSEEIINKRPYSSVEDFRSKVKVDIEQMSNLIKSGSFDHLYPNSTREEILKDFIWNNCDRKKTLNLRNLNGLIEADLVPPEYLLEKRLYGFTKILKSDFKQGNNYVLSNEQLLSFYTENFDTGILKFKDNIYYVDQKMYDKVVYQPHMDIMREWIKDNKEELLEKYNDYLFKPVWEKYGEGNISAWEMKSVSFYYHEHELAHINKKKYQVTEFYDLPTKPIVERWLNFKKSSVPIYKLDRIVGTVLQRNKIKSTVTLLTTKGVVQVRFRKSYFANYDKRISEVQEDGTKKVIEESWFKKGNKILITGYRRGDQFVPKTYAKSTVHTLYLIESIDENGDINLRGERIYV